MIAIESAKQTNKKKGETTKITMNTEDKETSISLGRFAAFIKGLKQSLYSTISKNFSISFKEEVSIMVPNNSDDTVKIQEFFNEINDKFVNFLEESQYNFSANTIFLSKITQIKNFLIKNEIKIDKSIKLSVFATIGLSDATKINYGEITGEEANRIVSDSSLNKMMLSIWQLNLNEPLKIGEINDKPLPLAIKIAFSKILLSNQGSIFFEIHEVLSGGSEYYVMKLEEKGEIQKILIYKSKCNFTDKNGSDIYYVIAWLTWIDQQFNLFLQTIKIIDGLSKVEDDQMIIVENHIKNIFFAQIADSIMPYIYNVQIQN